MARPELVDPFEFGTDRTGRLKAVSDEENEGGDVITSRLFAVFLVPDDGRENVATYLVVEEKIGNATFSRLGFVVCKLCIIIHDSATNADERTALAGNCMLRLESELVRATIGLSGWWRQTSYF